KYLNSTFQSTKSRLILTNDLSSLPQAAGWYLLPLPALPRSPGWSSPWPVSSVSIPAIFLSDQLSLRLLFQSSPQLLFPISSRPSLQPPRLPPAPAGYASPGHIHRYSRSSPPCDSSLRTLSGSPPGYIR